MKKIILYICMFFPLSAFGNTFTDVTIKNHRVQYIEYDISSEIYDLQIGISGKGSNLQEIIGNYGGVSGLNGVFFCPVDYTECKGKNSTINERFIQGKEISTYKSTGERVVFAWDVDMLSFLHQTDKINPGKRDDIYEGFANFPLLLQGGKNMLEHYHDVGLIDKKMRVPATRHFICSDQSKEHILFGSVRGVSLNQEIPILLEIGCWDALNLDAGASSAFIYNGKYLEGPGRDVMDAVVITRKGFNPQEIETELQPIFLKLKKIYLYKKTNTRAKNELHEYTNAIKKIKTNIYSKYEAKTETGYFVDVTSLSDLKRIYILNKLQEEISEILKELD